MSAYSPAPHYINNTKYRKLGYNQIILADNPFAYYPLQDAAPAIPPNANNSLVDLISPTVLGTVAVGGGGASTATASNYQNTPILTPLGPCLNFPFATGPTALYVQLQDSIANSTKFNFPSTASISAEIWLQPASLNQETLLFNINGLADVAVVFEATGTGTFILKLYNFSSIILTTSPIAFTTSSYLYIVGVWSPTGVRLYCNGVLIGSTSTGWHGCTEIPFGLGFCGNYNTAFNTGWNGKLSQCAFYGYDLTITKILNHYHSGGGI